jgi:hypothetical protein
VSPKGLKESVEEGRNNKGVKVGGVLEKSENEIVSASE